MLPKPPKEAYLTQNGFNVDVEIINAIKNELIRLADLRKVNLTEDHILAETVTQFNDQMKNDKPNIVVTITQTTSELLAEYEGMTRELLILELKNRPASRKKTYAEMALTNPFF